MADYGVALTVEHTFGLSSHSDLGPTAGTGFVASWPDDVAALAELGVDAIRLTFDWARLQPRPQTLADDWAELYDQLVDAIRALDIRLWATALDRAIPRWFDDEGGTGDVEALNRWWPRWLERVAERWGDRTDGWLPFDAIPAGGSRAWSDSWGILRGGGAPVAAAVALTEPYADTDVTVATARLSAIQPEADALALTVGTTDDPWQDPLALGLREVADTTDLPVLVARCALGDRASENAAALRDCVDEARADGVDVIECFADPTFFDDDVMTSRS